jgi:5''-nucleotidase/2'',3''-cyclic phosphodiesterase and related esterases
VVLHINDTHSRIEPMPANDSRNANKGGMIRLEAAVENERKENKNVLLLHSGDLVQGTPYFNVFKGRAEVEILNFMKVDAAAIGNHEFDYGLDVLKDMVELATFPFLSTNLDFSETNLDGMTHEYIILKKDGINIGLIGLTPNPDGLVAKDNYKGMIFLDPIESANKTADHLRNDKKCDLIICLSHLGYYTHENAMGDIRLAKNSRNIDIIIGGHTHFVPGKPHYVYNADGKPVLIDQAGGLGLDIGRIEVKMEEE